MIPPSAPRVWLCEHLDCGCVLYAESAILMIAEIRRHYYWEHGASLDLKLAARVAKDIIERGMVTT